MRAELLETMAGGLEAMAAGLASGVSRHVSVPTEPGRPPEPVPEAVRRLQLQAAALRYRYGGAQADLVGTPSTAPSAAPGGAERPMRV